MYTFLLPITGIFKFLQSNDNAKSCENMDRKKEIIRTCKLYVHACYLKMLRILDCISEVAILTVYRVQKG